MKMEQVVILIFSVLGLVIGIVSKIVTELFFSVSIATVGYLVVLFVTIKIFKARKKNWLIQNSLLSFVLVWILVWILYFNMG